MISRVVRMAHVCIQVMKMENLCTFPYTLITPVVAATKDHMFNEFEKQICHTLNIKNLGDSNYYLGIKFERYDNGIFLLHKGLRKLTGFTLTTKSLGNLKYYTGIQLERYENEMFLLHQKGYIKENWTNPI